MQKCNRDGIDPSVERITFHVRGEPIGFHRNSIEKFSMYDETIEITLKDQRVFAFFTTTLDYIEFYPKSLV